MQRARKTARLLLPSGVMLRAGVFVSATLLACVGCMTDRDSSQSSVGATIKTRSSETQAREAFDKASQASTLAEASSITGGRRPSREGLPKDYTGAMPASKLHSRFQFAQRAEKVGLEFSYRNGEEAGQFSILENLGGGVCVCDFDCDGWDDIFLAGGGTIGTHNSIAGLPPGLFANRSGTFQLVTIASRLAGESRYTHGVSTVDFDNDGFEDFLITGFGGASLFLNLGDGTFTEYLDASIRNVSGVVTSAAEGDFNGDGFPDLYIATYVDWSFANHPFCAAPSGDKRELCSPKEFEGTRDFLLLNSGDGRFVLSDTPESGFGKGLGVLAVDIDQDADVDIYVANDTDENFLFVNQGEGNFEELGMLSGVALDERGLPNGSMGLSACDIDDDLKVDLWVANYERESFAIYRNEENLTFLHTSLRYGISALGGLYVGFGTDWEDFDGDGREEIVVTNGHVLRYPTGAPRRQKPLLLSKSDSRFVVESFPPEDYFSGQYEGRGLAVGDFNRDQRPDVVISHINENVALLENQTVSTGKFVRVRLVGVQSARHPVGATLVLSTESSEQLRSVVGGGSYLSCNSPVVSFGVPPDTVDASLSIVWPSGIRQTVEIAVGQQHETVVVEALSVE